MPEKKVAASPERPLGVAATVLGLCGFAFAQPLFQVLGNGATFFSAHRVGRAEVLMFVALVIALPVVAVLGVLLIAYAISPRRFPVALSIVTGVLVAAVMAPHLDKTLGLSFGFFLLVGMVVAGAVALAYRRSSTVRQVAPMTAVGPALFAIVFLFFSPVSDLVVSTRAAAGAQTSATTNVIFVVFDEFPVGSLLNTEQEIDAARFPGFARLAQQSTWYRNAATVAPYTNIAVPALLSGQVPYTEKAPVIAAYPRNLFTMLEASHLLHGYELATYLCPSDSCGGAGGAEIRTMYQDAAIVFLHGLLPDDVAGRWLPSITDGWSHFATDRRRQSDLGGKDLLEKEQAAQSADQSLRFRDFLTSISPNDGSRPQLWYGHFLLPHLPSTFLPGGESFNAGRDTPGSVDEGQRWAEDRGVVEVSRQLFMFQAKYVDALVGRLLDRIESAGIGDDTLLVVVADHGLVFSPGQARRGLPLMPETAEGILGVPLFVKYPGVAGGTVDDQPRETIDILPTIAEVLDVRLPGGWSFDGRSLREQSGVEDRHFRHPGVSAPLDLDLAAASAPFLAQFGTGRKNHDVFAWGPHAELVGASTAELDVGPNLIGATWALTTPGIEEFDPASRPLPLPAEFELQGARRGEWVAIAVNGTIAGLGPVYLEGSKSRATVMIEPSALRAGRNVIRPYLVGEGGMLRPLPAARS